MEQVNPLVVQAQRKLIQKIEKTKGPSPPQPHYQKAQQELGEAIDGKVYTNLQLKLKGDVVAEAEQEPDDYKAFLSMEIFCYHKIMSRYPGVW